MIETVLSKESLLNFLCSRPGCLICPTCQSTIHASRDAFFLSHILSLHVSHLSRSSLNSGQRQLERSYIFLKRVNQHSSKTDHSPPRMSCPQLGSPKFVRQPFHQRLCKFRCDLRGHCYAQRFLVGCDLSV